MAVTIQRGLCPVCRREQKLTAQGTVDYHRGRLRQACMGRWKQPMPGQQLVDHQRPLPASVAGRGTVAMKPEEIAATLVAPVTHFGIGRAAEVAERLDGRLR